MRSPQRNSRSTPCGLFTAHMTLRTFFNNKKLASISYMLSPGVQGKSALQLSISQTSSEPQKQYLPQVYMPAAQQRNSINISHISIHIFPFSTFLLLSPLYIKCPKHTEWFSPSPTFCLMVHRHKWPLCPAVNHVDASLGEYVSSCTGQSNDTGSESLLVVSPLGCRCAAGHGPAIPLLTTLKASRAKGVILGIAPPFNGIRVHSVMNRDLLHSRLLMTLLTGCWCSSSY